LYRFISWIKQPQRLCEQDNHPTTINKINIIVNKTTLSFLRQLTTWHCSQLLLSAGRAAVDQISCWLGSQQQTRRTLLQQSIHGTDAWTPYCYIDPAAHWGEQ